MKFSRRSELLTLLVLLTGIAVLAPRQRVADSKENLYACRGNVKILRDALNAYCTDWSGHYPPDLGMLVPKYLSEIPKCPAAGVCTYEMEVGPEARYNGPKFEDYFFVYCSGHDHAQQGEPVDSPGDFSGCHLTGDGKHWWNSDRNDLD